MKCLIDLGVKLGSLAWSHCIGIHCQAISARSVIRIRCGLHRRDERVRIVLFRLNPRIFQS